VKRGWVNYLKNQALRWVVSLKTHIIFRFTLSPAFGRKTWVGGWGGNGDYYGTLADSGFRIVKLVAGDKLLTSYCKVTITQNVQSWVNTGPNLLLIYQGY